MIESDPEVMADLLGDPEVMAFYAHPRDPADALGWIQDHDRRARLNQCLHEAFFQGAEEDSGRRPGRGG